MVALFAHPPSGKLVFHPGAKGAEHHGIPDPPVLELLELLDEDGVPKIAKVEKLGALQVSVFVDVFTEQLSSLSHALP
jgi:hypothetical protein